MNVILVMIVHLWQLKPDDTIESNVDFEEWHVISAELKASYQEIKEYVQRFFAKGYFSGKTQMGLEPGQNYNLPRSA